MADTPEEGRHDRAGFSISEAASKTIKPELIDASKLLPSKSARPYNEIKDSKITTAALAVILLVAVCSVIALLLEVFLPFTCVEVDKGVSCTPRDVGDWPAEMLRLALVASLAFVMGSNGQSK